MGDFNFIFLLSPLLPFPTANVHHFCTLLEKSYLKIDVNTHLEMNKPIQRSPKYVLESSIARHGGGREYG